jgi:ATP-dependent protease HslVU (ClpYQ) peptidase subunit
VTTVATDGKSMAADGRAVNGRDTIVAENVLKLHRVCDAHIGFSGGEADGHAFVRWFMKMREKADYEPLKVADDFGALVLYDDGLVVLYDHELSRVTVELPYAIGTGSQLALGAMLAGASPEQAVKIAASRDVWSGGAIRSVALDCIAKLEAVANG